MMRAKGQIERTGRVAFGDASISITEEWPNHRMSWDERKAWEARFKRDVFTRVVQMLSRLSWACAVPPKEEAQNSASFALNFRSCSKGDLKGELHISGRCIDFKMWQSVNTPTRPDHGGRYESDLEGCMPYPLRLEMERTRRRIRDYLCNVFTGYEFDPKRYTSHRKPLAMTAMEQIQQKYAESCHFKGDLAKYEISDYKRKSADGVMLQHGQRVWFADWHGRICTGTAFYNINNMWWVVTGKYDYTNNADFELYVKCPENPRVKRNSKLRRQRLEQELNRAVKCMDFKRAQVLKDVLFPAGPLYAIWHKEHALFFGSNYSGYRNSIADAGKYTVDELKPYLNGAMETERFKAVPIGGA
jgi:hypothetical protein